MVSSVVSNARGISERSAGLTIRSSRTAAGELAVLSCGRGRSGRLAQALALTDARSNP